MATSRCFTHGTQETSQLARISWEWVTSDGSDNPDQAAIVLHPIEESRASKTGEHDETVIIDNGACSSPTTCTASHWRAGSLLAGFSSSRCPSRCRNSPRETSALCATAHGSPETVADRDPGQGEDGKPRDQQHATQEVVSPPDECVFGCSL